MASIDWESLHFTAQETLQKWIAAGCPLTWKIGGQEVRVDPEAMFKSVTFTGEYAADDGGGELRPAEPIFE